MWSTLANLVAAFTALVQVVNSAGTSEPDCTTLPGPSHTPSISTSKPNVLVFMSDDQDRILSGEKAMPNVVKKIARQGVTYEKHFCTVAWCCPSRVNFFTGKAAHNTNVTSISPPYGGWQKFVEEGLNKDWLPVWLQEAGIDTYYVGKLMNGYNDKNFDNDTRPKGWTHSSFLVDPYTYFYHNATFTNDGSDELEPYPGIHTTEVTEVKALSYLDKATSSNKPFFMMVATVAPHLQEPGGGGPIPPSPPGFETAFQNETVPRTPNFNPVQRSGASWVYALDRLNESLIHQGDMIYRNKLRNIAGVDQLVGNMIDLLDAKGQLDNTYIIYTTDNGFHIGQHRMHPGKRCGYEEDINIPLYIRGPDVAVNQKSGRFNSHTDMAPTILKMFNISVDDKKYQFDGAPVDYTEEDMNITSKKELINVEFWDSATIAPAPFSKRSHPDDGDHRDGDLQPDGTNYGNTYKSIRMRTASESFYYSVWCSGNFTEGEGDHELYDMNRDSQQMHNLYLSSGPKARHQSTLQYFNRPVSQLYPRLDALLMVLKSCKQETCRNPWPTLFPNGEVDSVDGAMAEKYDEFFQNQTKVSFSGCERGHFVEMEGPQEVHKYGQQNQNSSSSGSQSKQEPTSPATSPLPTPNSPSGSVTEAPPKVCTATEVVVVTKTTTVYPKL